MQAVVMHQTGDPDVLHFEEADRPELGDGEVLIRVRAVSVNPMDWHLMTGVPYIARPGNGWRCGRGPRRSKPPDWNRRRRRTTSGWVGFSRGWCVWGWPRRARP